MIDFSYSQQILSPQQDILMKNFFDDEYFAGIFLLVFFMVQTCTSGCSLHWCKGSAFL